MFWGVVPMSWRRQVRRYVSLKVGLDQVGKAWRRIAWPGGVSFLVLGWL